MNNTGWHLEDHDPAAVAMPYTRKAGEAVAIGHYGYPDYPDGQLRSTVVDLGLFAASFLGGGELHGTRILSEDSVASMFTPPLPAFDDQGVFWFTGTMRDHTYWGHSGGDQGVQTDLKIFPESGFAIVVLMNTDNAVAWTGLMHVEREMIKKAELLLAE